MTRARASTFSSTDSTSSIAFSSSAPVFGLHLELGLRHLGDEFRVLHRGIEGLAPGGQPVGGHTRRQQRRPADDRAGLDQRQDLAALRVGDELAEQRHVGQIGLPRCRRLAR